MQQRSNAGRHQGSRQARHRRAPMVALGAGVALGLWSAAAAQDGTPRLDQPGRAVAPPTSLRAADRPNDKGDAMVLSWEASPDDTPEAEPRIVVRYEILRAVQPSETLEHLVDVPYGTMTYTDPTVHAGVNYRYGIAAVGPRGRSETTTTESWVHPVVQIFDWSRAWFGLILLILCGAVMLFISLARRGMPLKVRQIAGLAAVDEAVGRATEMGRPILFVPGVQDMNDIQTIAGITVLARVARTAAEYDAKVEVPTARSLVMTTARETVQAAFLAAGRPDAYNEDLIYYVTDEQFGYVAYLQGMMVREKPAACFYMGTFFAESLILAETGNAIGAIQIAGTAQPAQLPFFVAACDYTLIGEEFFAASAYLSGEPDQLGSLKGQDVGKIIVAVGLVIGCTLATLDQFFPGGIFHDWLAVLLGRILA
jgi:hypothetical protein